MEPCSVAFFIHLQLLVILIALSRGVRQQFREWMVISCAFSFLRPNFPTVLTTRLDRISYSVYSAFLSVCTVFLSC